MPRRNHRPRRPSRHTAAPLSDPTLDTDDLALSLVQRGLATVDILDAMPRIRRGGGGPSNTRSQGTAGEGSEKWGTHVPLDFGGC